MRRLAPLLVLVCLLAGGGVLFAKRNNILDYLALRGYQPPAAIQTLAAETTMTPIAERLFFVNKPVLAEKKLFNQHCTDGIDQVATLGCYKGDRRGIYLYDVTDARLNGVEEVTAAHEMLHQAYDRLSAAEKQRVDALLQAYYEQLKDPFILDQMETYKKTEPGQLVNEMHSIFGTQVHTLPPDLETYYKQYFTDRTKIIAFYEQYQAEFTKRRTQIAAYDAQLDSLKDQIETHKASLKRREAQLTAQRNQLDALLDQNRIAEYNQAVPGFNDLVNGYRAEVSETNRVINEFNNVLDARNAIAVQEQELQKALDSQIDTVQ